MEVLCLQCQNLSPIKFDLSPTSTHEVYLLFLFFSAQTVSSYFLIHWIRFAAPFTVTQIMIYLFIYCSYLITLSLLWWCLCWVYTKYKLVSSKLPWFRLNLPLPSNSYLILKKVKIKYSCPIKSSRFKWSLLIKISICSIPISFLGRGEIAPFSLPFHHFPELCFVRLCGCLLACSLKIAPHNNFSSSSQAFLNYYNNMSDLYFFNL